VSAGHRNVHTLTPWSAGIQAGHLRRYAAFIQVDQVFGRDLTEQLPLRPMARPCRMRASKCR
jgi:hypothetical protein